MSISRFRNNLRRSLRAAALLLAVAGSAHASPPALFNPVAPSPARLPAASAAAPLNHAQRLVALDTAAMDIARKGDVFSIAAPSGVAYDVTYDRTDAAYAGGQVWVGHLSEFGRDYPVIISTYEGQVDGSIATSWGMLRLRGARQATVLTDTAAAGELVFEPTIDDSLNPQVLVPSSAYVPMAATASATSQIDLLMLFTPSLQTRLGGYSQTIARLNYLTGVANTVYQNSGINIVLSIVSAQPYSTSYTDQTDGVALGAVNPPSGLSGDTAVAAMRTRYGADLVTLVRPFVAANGVCGLAWIVGSGPSAYGFSVFEDGTDSGYYCHETTMTHELGHNMGAAHDAGTATQGGGSINGNPSYNRGYCNGTAGTVMAYTSTIGCSPLVYSFSDPALGNTCGGGACGINSATAYNFSYKDGNGVTQTGTATGADSTTAINANAPSIAGWQTAPTKFTPLVPARVLDTRAGASTADGLFAGGGGLGTASQLDLTLAGRGGVPAIRAGAVVLNVTAVSPSAAGFLVAWPAGSARPTASNINFVPGQTIPNLVVAKLSGDGKVSLYNYAGTTDVVADVAGWFPAASTFTALNPARVLDTRSGPPVPAATAIDFVVAGAGGVPATGAGAVVFNLTATQPTASGYVTAWPSGTALGNASNLNFSPGQTVANLAIVKIGSNGKVSLFNSNGNTHLIADVAGWFPTSSELTALAPARVLDTRPGMTTSDGQFAGGGGIGGGAELDLTVTGRGGVPASGVGAVVLNVTAVTPSSPGFLTVWPAGSARPTASNLNFTAGAVVQNLVIAKVGTGGQVAIFNSAGSTQVVADVVGWFAPGP
ncbi:reprolysin-like metallopeptidase [Rudaea sp.]|uniref:M12 family metallo-peptidase n=1 Tax=Rudaea sp. TaxID=2136325 RepID=UPI0032207944